MVLRIWYLNIPNSVMVITFLFCNGHDCGTAHFQTNLQRELVLQGFERSKNMGISSRKVWLADDYNPNINNICNTIEPCALQNPLGVQPQGKVDDSYHFMEIWLGWMIEDIYNWGSQEDPCMD